MHGGVSLRCTVPLRLHINEVHLAAMNNVWDFVAWLNKANKADVLISNSAAY
jgi:hypothetical protein